MKFLEIVEDWYYTVIPFEYRPKNVWYQFKCWAWKRHTTIKPRGLGHTWCDKCHLMPHMIFEMLCEFMEKEVFCYDGKESIFTVDWEADDIHSNAMKEMKELYNWWLNDFDDENYDSGWISPEYNKLVLTQCKRVVDISPFMWT